MDQLFTFAIAAVVGVGIGILSGLLGIGGGTILVPVLRLGFGLAPIASTATSLFTIIPTAVSGLISHIRSKTCNIPLGVACGLGGAATSPVGVWLATISPSWAIMGAAALIIGYSAANMLWKAARMKSAAAGDPAAELEEAAIEAEMAAGKPVRMTRRQLLIGALIGLVAGVASGYIGVGGGFIMVPFMLAFVGLPMKLASGTSLIAVAILSVPGVIEQAMLGNVNYVIGIAVAVGSIPGAFIGAKLVKRVPERTLRFIFGGFLIVAALLLLLNDIGIM